MRVYTCHLKNDIDLLDVKSHFVTVLWCGTDNVSVFGAGCVGTVPDNR